MVLRAGFEAIIVALYGAVMETSVGMSNHLVQGTDLVTSVWRLRPKRPSVSDLEASNGSDGRLGKPLRRLRSLKEVLIVPRSDGETGL